MKKLLAVIITFLSLALPLQVRATGQSEWPTFHGDTARTGFSNSKAPSSSNLLWEINTNQLREYGINQFQINSSIINQNKVFFTSEYVFAADLASGKIIWNYKGDQANFFAGNLTAGDNKIFVAVANSSLLKEMSEGFVYALDEKNGQFLWKYQTKKAISHSNPVFAENKVFIGDDSGSVFAIEAETGKLVWQKQLEAYQIHSSPAYEAGVIFVGTETHDISGGRTDRGSYLYALDAKDGQEIWRFETNWRSNEMPNLIHGTPAVSDGVVYFGSENGYFYALGKTDGKLIWKKIITKKEKTLARQAASPGLVGTSATPALGYGKIFIGTWEGKFLALSQKDGATVWEYNYGNEGTDSSAVLADGKVCLGSHYEYFYCFNQENGKTIWKEKLGGPSAALANGILVVPNALAADSPGPALLAFSDKGSLSFSVSSDEKKISSFNKEYLLLIPALIFVFLIWQALKSKRLKLKQLLIFGGIPLLLIILGVFVYRSLKQARWTGEQTTLVNQGQIDPATGSFIVNDGSAKHVEYQGKRYFLNGDYCSRSNLARFPINVKRINGAVAADGPDGNTMYAIGDLNNPEYIDTGNGANPKGINKENIRDCWKKEAK